MKKVIEILLVLVVIAIIGIMGVLIYKLNNEKNLSNEKIISLNNQVQILEETIENLKNENSKELETENEIEYIEMTEENYKQYNTNGYRFEIAMMKVVGDGTATVSGRVYKEKELPTITAEEYQTLLNGNTVQVMGVEMKATVFEKAELAGHDMLIEAVSKESALTYYVTKNTDGTGKLAYYGPDISCIGTDIYLELIVDENVPTESGLGNITLKEYLQGWSGDGKMPDEVDLPDYNEEIVFENGKCVKILFTSI